MFLQRDMNVRELRELNRNAMRVFGDVIHQYPDVSQAVTLYFHQAGLPPPPGPGSNTSSRMTSRASSSRSSLASSRSSTAGGSGIKPKPVTIGLSPFPILRTLFFVVSYIVTYDFGVRCCRWRFHWRLGLNAGFESKFNKYSSRSGSTPLSMRKSRIYKLTSKISKKSLERFQL